MEVSGHLHAPVIILPPGKHWIGGWVGPRAGLDAVEKRRISCLSGIELRFHSHPADSLVAITAELFESKGEFVLQKILAVYFVSSFP
jgi:hypothetical protein